MVNKYREFGIVACLLTALTFIVWIKVTTDIFFIDALLFCAVGDYEDVPEGTATDNTNYLTV